MGHVRIRAGSPPESRALTRQVVTDSADAHRRHGSHLAYGDLEDGRTPTFAQTVDFSNRAERVGLDSIWVFDHLLFRFPDEPDEGLHEARTASPRWPA